MAPEIRYVQEPLNTVKRLVEYSVVLNAARNNIREDVECKCGCPVPMRHHIFTHCGVLNTNIRPPRFIRELIGFLAKNPTAFGFANAPRGDG